jgi:hypothetical protein
MLRALQNDAVAARHGGRHAFEDEGRPDDQVPGVSTRAAERDHRDRRGEGRVRADAGRGAPGTAAGDGVSGLCVCVCVCV